MVEMVRNHTVPDTEDWRTIVPIVERTREMLRAAKDVKMAFVSCMVLQMSVLSANYT